MTIRKLIGLLVALIGILTGAALSAVPLMLMLAYWGAPENPGYEGTAVFAVMALLGAGIGFIIFRIGRKIAG